MRNQYDKFIYKTVPTEDIIKMAESFLKNKLFESNLKFYKQISGAAIGTKFAPPYGCIFMDTVPKISGDRTLALEKIHR